jgi:hypothetical protein
VGVISLTTVRGPQLLSRGGLGSVMYAVSHTVSSRAVDSESEPKSEGILGGVGVGRNC